MTKTKHHPQIEVAPKITGPCCPDCMHPLGRMPRLRADARCARCKSKLKTREDKRAERAARQLAKRITIEETQ